MKNKMAQINIQYNYNITKHQYTNCHKTKEYYIHRNYLGGFRSPRPIYLAITLR